MFSETWKCKQPWEWQQASVDLISIYKAHNSLLVRNDTVKIYGEVSLKADEANSNSDTGGDSFTPL